MNNKRSKFPYLIGFSAILVAFSSAFFSVFGISQLFAGAKTQVIIMASSLEFSKLVLATFLYRYWIKVNKGIRTYMTIAILILMIITSVGIYGYLSSAYQMTATKIEKKDIEISTLIQKKSLDSLDAVRLQDRYNKLTNLRTVQETRLDTLYNRKQNNVAKRTEDLINKTNIEISQLDSIIRIKNDNISKINGDIYNLNSENISGEIGPLKYLSDLTGLPMNKVVNIFILLLIFVFDPLAVTMVVGANVAFIHTKDNNNQSINNNENVSDNNKKNHKLVSKIRNFIKNDLKKKETIVDGGEIETTVNTMNETSTENKTIKENSEIDKDNLIKSEVDDVQFELNSMTNNNEIKEINKKNEKIDDDMISDDDLNIYGENLKEIKKNEIKQEVLNVIKEEPKEKKIENYSSIIQNPPKSAYTPGGGIRVNNE